MMSCKEAARLVSKKRDRSLSLGEHFGLRMHLAMCKLCATYRRQIDVIGTLSRRAGELLLGDPAPHAGLPADARDRIKKRLSDV